MHVDAVSSDETGNSYDLYTESFLETAHNRENKQVMNSIKDPVSVLRLTYTHFKQRHLGCHAHFGSVIGFHIRCEIKR